jgi:hypothetical protein
MYLQASYVRKLNVHARVWLYIYKHNAYKYFNIAIKSKNNHSK